MSQSGSQCTMEGGSIKLWEDREREEEEEETAGEGSRVNTKRYLSQDFYGIVYKPESTSGKCQSIKRLVFLIQ